MLIRVSRPRRAGMLLAALATGVALLAATAGQAEAQGHPHNREGFWINFGAGYGSLGLDGLDDREGGLSGNLALGGTLSQRFLLGGGTTGWTKEVDGVRINFGTVLLLARFYPSATGGFFLTAGLGGGQVGLSQGSTSISESGGGALLGLGFDARVGANWSITSYANSIGISVDGGDANILQFGVGVTFH